MYKKLIDALSKFENGKYASQIKSIKDFDLEEYSSVIKTGVNDSRVTYSYDSRMSWVDELLNETSDEDFYSLVDSMYKDDEEDNK